jgi:type IV pilus assembly protein PilZ
MEKAIMRASNVVDLSERRKSERVELLVRVTYQSVDELFSEFARNINEGGIFIETDTPQEPGSPVGLQFKLPGSDELIEVVGTVVRSSDGSDAGDSAGMGIEFGDLNASARQRINDLIRGLRSIG